MPGGNSESSCFDFEIGIGRSGELGIVTGAASPLPGGSNDSTSSAPGGSKSSTFERCVGAATGAGAGAGLGRSTGASAGLDGDIPGGKR